MNYFDKIVSIEGTIFNISKALFFLRNITTFI